MASTPHGREPFGLLTRSAEFQELRRGKRFEAKFGHLRGIARARSTTVPFPLRFGLIVPKKLGNAPRRNRIKRRLREGLRLAQMWGCFDFEKAGQYDAKRGVDIGIFPSSCVLVMDFDALVSQLCAGVEALMRKLARLPI
jgi:ribonuclease P protein component